MSIVQHVKLHDWTFPWVGSMCRLDISQGGNTVINNLQFESQYQSQIKGFRLGLNNQDNLKNDDSGRRSCAV